MAVAGGNEPSTTISGDHQSGKDLFQAQSDKAIRAEVIERRSKLGLSSAEPYNLYETVWGEMWESLPLDERDHLNVQAEAQRLPKEMSWEDPKLRE